MEKNRYWECQDCRQVVQGWGAMQDIDCCPNKNMLEIPGPEEQEIEEEEPA